MAESDVQQSPHWLKLLSDIVAGVAVLHNAMSSLCAHLWAATSATGDAMPSRNSLPQCTTFLMYSVALESSERLSADRDSLASRPLKGPWPTERVHRPRRTRIASTSLSAHFDVVCFSSFNAAGLFRDDSGSHTAGADIHPKRACEFVNAASDTQRK